MRYYTFSGLLFQVFEIWCVFRTYRTCQFGLAPFQVLSSHMGLVATDLDGAPLEDLFRKVNSLFYIFQKW